jgi:thymidylate synthase (FAD)
VLPDKWYVPETVGGKSKDKKQGQEDNLPIEVQEEFREYLKDTCQDSYALYLRFLGMGVAPEHARMFLHLNHYVHWLGNVDLHNLFHFLRLRTHSHAQWEARQYAGAIVELLRPHLPGLMILFDKHVRRPE